MPSEDLKSIVHLIMQQNFSPSYTKDWSEFPQELFTEAGEKFHENNFKEENTNSEFSKNIW